jgi:hypothetical protein
MQLEQEQQRQPRPRLGVVTIHDACPAFSTKILESADELERPNIKYNIALVPFFNEKQNLLESFATISKCTTLGIIIEVLK